VAPIGVAYCKDTERDGDAGEAARRWWDLRKRLPRQIAAHCGYIACMLSQQRYVEDEYAAQSALRFLGERPELLVAHAQVAEPRDDLRKRRGAGSGRHGRRPMMRRRGRG
jgi:hypothetical protein